MRGVFTAGVLDAFLDGNLEFQYVNGVSAGASQGAGFVSRQRGRARQVMTGFIRDPRYFGWRNLLREGNAFGTEFVYRTIPCSLLPFDFDAFNSSPVRFEIGTTDGLTGLPVFWDHRRDPQTMLEILRASCSLPFLARPVILEGAPHMDGGLSDPIPWERALQQGAEFLVVVLTRPAGYRKKPHLPGPATRLWYRKLPGITGALSRRHLVYNHQLDQLEELERAGIRGEIDGRPKHIYSIWRKMRRKQVGIEEVFDISAVRVLVETIPECYAVLGQVHSLWPYIAGEFDDYIANPKGNFYRSLHTAVMGPGNEPLEVQIRTREMHEHAELGVAAHWRYKEGGRGDPAFEQKISWLRQLLAPGEEGETDRDLLDQLRTEIFEDRVYAFTPAGDVVDLPAGATPLDFAYQVHTNIGHHCRGALVNGRMVQLTHQLRNGDKVEILTAKNAHPSRDWLSPQAGYLASPRSRSKVRSWFRQLDQDQNRRSGKQALEKELARLGLELKLEPVARRFGFNTEEQLWLAIGAGDLTLPAVIAACERESPPPLPRVTEEVQVKARRPAYTEAAVSISGVGDLMTNFARCCRPLPPEPIAGYITQGRGVSIHRANCKNLLRLQADNPERLMAVDWGGREHASYPVAIEVQAWDRTGLIRDISATLADEKIDIHSMTTRTERVSHVATIDITVGIASLEHLSRLMSRIGRLPNVTSVRRRS